MVDGGGPTPSVAIAHAKPLSTNAQPLQSPLPVRDGQSLHQRRQCQNYLRDAIPYYGVDSNLVLASKPTPANRKAEMLGLKAELASLRAELEMGKAASEPASVRSELTSVRPELEALKAARPPVPAAPPSATFTGPDALGITTKATPGKNPTSTEDWGGMLDALVVSSRPTTGTSGVSPVQPDYSHTRT